MALVTCGECGREISDKAPHCIGCGAPVAAAANITALPMAVRLEPDSTFIGTKALLVKLAAKAVLQIGWKLDSADEQAGMIGFTTGITWGSWSGVSGTIYMEDLGGNRFRPTGSAKQNVRGGQLIALNIGNEAQGKVNRVIEMMRTIALANKPQD